MEISWKWSSFCLCLLFFQLCNGYPLDRGDTFTDQNTKLISGIISLLLTICGLVFLAGCLCCHRRNAFKQFRNSPVTVTVGTELDHGHVNPIANGEFTIFTPLSPPHFNNNIFLASDQIVTRTFENQELNDSNLKCWFNDAERDFPRIKLKYIKELGRGWFGKVVKGAAQDIDKGQVWTPVVVRILDATSSQKEKIQFLQDASIYRYGIHQNILSLFGRCLDTVPFLLLQEYCPQGDLKAYLRSKKSQPEQVLSTEYPLLWCCQLTSALKHLHDNNITHPDLAARNCQLTADLTLKVGDYGLGVFRYSSDYYQGAAGVPVRWRAPESLTWTPTTIQPKEVDREGNVWSLGVTMWEIFECGELPYAQLTDDEVVTQVFGEARLRLTRPSYTAIYTDYIYRLMQLCWTNAESRPTVSQIHLMLNDLLQVHQNTVSNPSQDLLSLDDFDQRWASLKPNSLLKTDDITVHFPSLRKNISPSLTNLHGSLDNLLADTSLSLFENDHSLTSERACNFDSSEQPVGGRKKSKTKPKHVDSSRSGSETEDDTWRNKVERGAYTEKVRQKSKSVADLMVLTHVDYSESESETPLPSLDYKVNYKNVRMTPETAVTYASEGNLLSIQDTFQEELKKLQEERRDSLLFVPDRVSGAGVVNFMQELNSKVDIKPSNQVFNVFNVSVDNFSPLEKIISFNESNVSGCDVDRSGTGSSLVDCVRNDESSSQNSCQTTKDEQVVQECEETNIDDSLENVSAKAPTEKSLYDNFSPMTEEELGVETNATNCAEFLIPREVEKLSDLIRNNVELKRYVESAATTSTGKEGVNFDVSSNQDVAMPNSLTHVSVFTSTPFKKKEVSLPVEDKYSSINLFGDPAENKDPDLEAKDLKYSLETWNNFLGTTFDNQHVQNDNLFESFSSEPKSLMFVDNEFAGSEDVYSPDVFDKNVVQEEGTSNEVILQKDGEVNTTFVLDQKTDNTFLTKEDDVGDDSNKTYVVENDLSPEDPNSGSWESGGGWFLHPQTNTDDLCGEMQMQPTTKTDTYVGFGIDDEIMSAIRNELITKLPHAQSATVEKVKDDDEWETSERSEVFLKYNVYNTPLSPIPEESYIEDSSGTNSPRKSCENNDSDWSEHCEVDTLTRDIPSHSPQTHESPMRGVLNMHTPSQDSCCSNDTLFNLEELVCNATELERGVEWNQKLCEDIEEPLKVTETQNKIIINEFLVEERNHASGEVMATTVKKPPNTLRVDLEFSKEGSVPLPSPEENPWKQLPASLVSMDQVASMSSSFLLENGQEMVGNIDNNNSGVENVPEYHLENNLNLQITDLDDESIPESSQNELADGIVKISDDKEVDDCESQDSESEYKTAEDHIKDLNKNDERVNDKETEKQLQETIVNKNTPVEFFETAIDILEVKFNTPNSQKSNMLKEKDETLDDKAVASQSTLEVEAEEETSESSSSEGEEEENPAEDIETKKLANSRSTEPEYANGAMENTYGKSQTDRLYENVNSEELYDDYVNIVNMENTKNSLEFDDSEKDAEYMNIYGNEEDAHSDNIFGVLTDIRFSGPSDSQLMSTSFSENNDDHDWDSGSDSRSSSSGEFIWKEGEHEESLKALRAAPQDLVENVKPMEGIAEGDYEGSDISSSFSDDDGEIPEFIPSAWDKFAIPSKSALRSPEKTLKKADEKPKGVWFKKQKYHCVYEYPKEPESPVLQSQDLWKAQSDFQSFADWEFDGEAFIPNISEEQDMPSTTTSPQASSSNRNLYQLTSITDFMNAESESPAYSNDFFISGSSQPFHTHSLSSQFFPGGTSWALENATPDSGVEDITPGSLSDYPPPPTAPFTLKHLASEAVNKRKLAPTKRRETLGGLRHTRDRLKLDLPPSPREKLFAVEPFVEEFVREKPTFSTFGKSRFQVQHVDTPSDEVEARNVSFEALPYKEQKECVDVGGKKLGVRGEASLLDSGDEDSGIESSTLERKTKNVQA